VVEDRFEGPPYPWGKKAVVEDRFEGPPYPWGKKAAEQKMECFE
jgi:hypothetical protein